MFFVAWSRTTATFWGLPIAVPTSVRSGRSGSANLGAAAGASATRGATTGGAGGRRDTEKIGRSRVAERALMGVPQSGLPRRGLPRSCAAGQQPNGSASEPGSVTPAACPRDAKPRAPANSSLFINIRPDKPVKHFTAYDQIAKWTIGRVSTQASATSAKSLLDKLLSEAGTRHSGRWWSRVQVVFESRMPGARAGVLRAAAQAARPQRLRRTRPINLAI